MAGLTTEKATQAISGSQTLLLFACDMFWSKPASYSQLHSYKQRWWLLRGTQVLVSWLLLWCWVDDYWSFFDYCCGVHPSHGLLRLGLPLPFQPEVTCFVHPLLHKDGKELPASIENMLIPKMVWRGDKYSIPHRAEVICPFVPYSVQQMPSNGWSASGLRGSRILSYPRHEKDNHQPGLSATSHAERGNLGQRQLYTLILLHIDFCYTLTL